MGSRPMKSIAGRQVRMFRCQIPPLIGPGVRNAYVPKDLHMEAEVDQSCTGVLVTNEKGQEDFVPFTNIQNISLYPEEAVEAKTSVSYVVKEPDIPEFKVPKRMGRPPKVVPSDAV